MRMLDLAGAGPPRALVAAGAAALAFAGCSRSGSPVGGFTVRDSAGVRIAASAGPAWKAGRGWRLADSPAVDVGKVEGDARYLFSNVGHGTLLPGGGFVVADGSHTLRGFSASGTFLWRTGREGDGPGEFEGNLSVELSPADSLVVFDPRLLRMSVFTPDGTFVRSARIESSGSFAGGTAAGVLPDGSIIVTQGGSSALLPFPPPAGSYREKDPAARFGPAGDSLGTIGTFPGMDWHIGKSAIGPSPFAHFAHFAVRDSTLVVGTGDGMEVQVYAPDGTLRRITRLAGYDTRLTGTEVQAFKKAWLRMGTTPEAHRREEAWLAELTIPDRRPAYSEVAVDPEGDLWLSGYHFVGYVDPSWYVFSPEGRFLGRIAFPQKLRVLKVGSSSVLGVWTDDLDVEHVRVYGIEK